MAVCIRPNSAAVCPKLKYLRLALTVLADRRTSGIEETAHNIKPTGDWVATKLNKNSYVLLISPDTEKNSPFKRMVMHLGYQVTLR